MVPHKSLIAGKDWDTKTLYSEYDVVKKIGQGGFGSVFLGIHKKTKVRVAIKFVDPKAFGDASQINKIFTEQESIKKLRHKNIISYLSTFMMNKQMVNIMDCCMGGELLELVNERKRLTEDEAKTIIKQVLSGIEYCHREFNLIHRDLKLENVLLVEKGKLDIKVRAGWSFLTVR
jgi:MAP/microtubule affinity-regulating kinase